MSSKAFRSRKDLPLEAIYDEVMEHIRSNGHFDEARMSSINSIWDDPYIDNIKATFVSECEQFCKQVDLGQNRNTLRAKLATRFDSYSTSRRDLKSHIGRLLQERSDDVRSKYYKHARAFLQRYLPKSSPEHEDNELDNNVKVEPQEEPQPEVEPEIEHEVEPEQDLQQLQADIDMDIESLSPKDDEDEEVEKPPYSPIGNSEDTMNEILKPNMTTPSLDEIPIPPDDDNINSSDISLPAEEPETKIENSWPLPIKGEESDSDDERLTFSSISSVKTADLSDWENSIKLSDDDEACVVGKPKNSKVPIKELLDNIEKKNDDLQTTSIDIKTESIEPVEASESDGGCSESTTSGRRLARTRKSNPRYSNEHYKLYN